MKVLQVHVYYTTTLTSGENSTVEAIGGFLGDYAIADTILFRISPTTRSFSGLVTNCLKILKDFFLLIAKHGQYDVIFFHNQIPFIPAIFLRYFSKHTTVVKVWHNFRPFCIKGSSFRSNKVCWKCSSSRLRKANALIHSCYRGSFGQTCLALISQIGILGILKADKVYNVTVSNFMEKKLISLGFSPTRVLSIQNSVSSSLLISPSGSDFIFIGRITSEKGIEKLLSAWEYYKSSLRGVQKLHVVGDGPLLIELREKYQDSRTLFHGHLQFPQISLLAEGCKVGLIPNLWEEPFGKVALDYLSLGLHILATKLGGLTEILEKDSGTEFISSLEPELLAMQMEDFALTSDPVDVLARKVLLQGFSQDKARERWHELLRFFEASAIIK